MYSITGGVGRACVLSITLLTLPACLASRHRIDIEPAVAVPEEWSTPAAGTQTADRWWEAFNDPTLNQLVERALAGNLNLQASLLRVEQSTVLVRQSRSGQRPTLDAEFGVNRSRQFVPPPIGSFEQTFFTGSLAASYEIDAWGRVRSGVRAAQSDAQALRHDAEAVAMTLVANVTEAWLDLRFHTMRRQLVERQVATLGVYRELLTLRLSNGLASAVDVLQQQQQIRGLESQLPQIDAAMQLSRHRLALLLGVPASEVAQLEAEAALPAVMLPEVGVPADLLLRRPDVMAAEARAAAADWRVVTAVADRLPTLRLSGNINVQAPNLLEFFDGFFWRIAAAAAAPVLDGGRRRAALERARLVREETLVTYGNTLLTAMMEVEDALTQVSQQDLYLQSLQVEFDNATQTLTSATARYQQGVIDYLPMLTAMTSLLQIETTQLQAQRTALTQQVSLYRALGGQWMNEVQRQPLAAETTAQGDDV